MMPRDPYYAIDPEIFLQTWYDTLQKNQTIQFMVELLQQRCDEDPKNKQAVENGAGKTLTVQQIDSKMNYYRKSYEMKIKKPRNELAKTQRKIRKEKFQDLFMQGGFIEDK